MCTHEYHVFGDLSTVILWSVLESLNFIAAIDDAVCCLCVREKTFSPAIAP